MSAEGSTVRAVLSDEEFASKLSASVRGPKARLAWLHVHSLDDIEEQRLQFGPEINVILGKNGVGKTTLLNLLSCVLRWDFTAWRQRAFDVEYQFELGDSFWHVRVTNVRDRELDQEGVAGYRSNVDVLACHDGMKLQIDSNGTTANRAVAGETGSLPCVELELSFLVHAVDNRTWPLVQIVCAPVGIANSVIRFDEGLDYFRARFERVTPQQAIRVEWNQKKVGVTQ